MLSHVKLFVTPWTSWTLCKPTCQAPLSMVILQARIVEWVAVPFFRGSSQPRDRTQIFRIAADSLPSEPPGKPVNTGVGSLSLLQGIFPIQEWNWGLLDCRWILYQLNCQGSPSLTRGLLIIWCSQGTSFGCHLFALFLCFLLHWFLLWSLLFPLFCVSFGLF